MASSPVTSWQTEGEKAELVTDFLFLGSKIIADDSCSHEIKRHLPLGRKAMTNLDSILKNTDTILLTIFQVVKDMVLLVVMYRYELDHKEAEHQRIDAFELWC